MENTSLVRIFEKNSERYEENSFQSVELSAFIEKDTHEDIRKSIGSQCSDFTIQKIVTIRPFIRRLKSKQARVPLTLCKSTFDTQKLLLKNYKKNFGSLQKQRKFVNQVSNRSKFNSTDYQNNFRITAFPLQIPGKHRRIKSLTTDKKSSKVTENSNKPCLVVKKSPPVVSGFSVTFYTKTIQN